MTGPIHSPGRDRKESVSGKARGLPTPGWATVTVSYYGRGLLRTSGRTVWGFLLSEGFPDGPQGAHGSVVPLAFRTFSLVNDLIFSNGNCPHFSWPTI